MPQVTQAGLNILDLSVGELRAEMVRAGLPSYRANQVLGWIFKKQAAGFEQMTNIPKAERALLAERFSIRLPRIVKTAASADDDTRKFLMRLEDGATIESVLMTDKGRATLCVSSQVGCALGCAFCATGQMGFQRNLTAGEIVGEVLMAERERRLSNLVFMGMGEPLLNLENVLKAIGILTDADGLALLPRRITVSTSGILAGIERLRKSGAGVNLALSLNSPFDEERRRLMPVARRCSIVELAAACEVYAAETGREVSLEYVMFSGVNTTARHAQALARLAAQIPATVNLIAFNTVKGSGFKPPEREEVHRFRDMLVAHRARVTIRYRRGRDIAAGCGQLRAQTDPTAETQRAQRRGWSSEFRG